MRKIFPPTIVTADKKHKTKTLNKVDMANDNETYRNMHIPNFNSCKFLSIFVKCDILVTKETFGIVTID